MNTTRLSRSGTPLTSMSIRRRKKREPLLPCTTITIRGTTMPTKGISVRTTGSNRHARRGGLPLVSRPIPVGGIEWVVNPLEDEGVEDAVCADIDSAESQERRV